LENKPEAEATLVVGIEAVTPADVLRVFDDMRRWLAASLHGTIGAFTGFQRLDVQQEALELLAPGDEITLTARVLRDTPRRTSVEFVATFERLIAAGWRARPRSLWALALSSIQVDAMRILQRSMAGQLVPSARPCPGCAWPSRSRRTPNQERRSLPSDESVSTFNERYRASAETNH